MGAGIQPRLSTVDELRCRCFAGPVLNWPPTLISSCHQLPPQDKLDAAAKRVRALEADNTELRRQKAQVGKMWWAGVPVGPPLLGEAIGPPTTRIQRCLGPLSAWPCLPRQPADALLRRAGCTL